jgi:tRNA(Ser,Leu) C12 N-acetylase TAN1
MQTTCYATLEEIVLAATPLVESYFTLKKNLKFAIVFKKRHSEVAREETVEALANIVGAVNSAGECGHTVSLKEPDVVLMIEIFKSTACLCVIPDGMYVP